MRSRNSLTLFLVLVVIGSILAVVAGCSSDKKAPTSDVAGSISDPDYLIVKEQVDHFVDSTLAQLKSGFNSISMLVTDTLIDPAIYGPIDPQTDSYSATYENGWHIIFISRLGGGFSTAVRDEIQYRDLQNTPQQDNSNIASMTYKHGWVFSVHNTTFDYSTYDGEMDIEYVNLNTEQASLSGSNEYHYFNMDYSSDPLQFPDVSRDVVVNGDLFNFQIPASNSGWSHSCPSTGTIDGTIELVTTEGSANPETLNYTFTLKFTNGELDYTIRRGSIYWHSVSTACNQPGI